MIATLVLLTCSLSGNDCKTTPVEVMPMMQCVVMWQLPAARYIGEHQDRVLIGYSCLPGVGGA